MVSKSLKGCEQEIKKLEMGISDLSKEKEEIEKRTGQLIELIQFTENIFGFDDKRGSDSTYDQ